MNGQITWHEDRDTGRGILTLAWDDGTEETTEGGPIDAGSDSHAVAGLFCRDAIDHDRDTVFVTK